MPYRLYINCSVYVSQVQDVKNCRLWHPYECPRAAFICCLICFNMAWTARPSDTCPSMMQQLSHSTAIVMPPPLQRAFSFLCCHCFKLERWVTLILPFLIIFVVQHLPPSNFCSFYFYTFLLFSLIFSPLAHSSFALTSIPQLFIAIANSRLFSSVSSLFAFCFCFFYCFNCFLTSLSCLLLLKDLLNGWLYV